MVLLLQLVECKIDFAYQLAAPLSLEADWRKLK